MSNRKKSPKEIQKVIEENETNVIDVRSVPERADGYIKNSICIDVQGRDFETKLCQLDKNKILILYCRSENRAAVAVSKAESLGFKDVYMIDGGITAWKNSKLPTEK